VDAAGPVVDLRKYKSEMSLRISGNTLFLALSICTALSAQDRVCVHDDDEAMGATFSVTACGGDRASVDAAVSAAFAEVHRLDRMLSNYDPKRE
jgi:hypothetical protein